jgi:hypothetical protein
MFQKMDHVLELGRDRIDALGRSPLDKVYKVVEIYRNLLVYFAKDSTLVELWKDNSHHDDSNKHVTSGSARYQGYFNKTSLAVVRSSLR